MKKIRVLIVEDSKVVRELLEYIIGQDPRLEVAGSVESGEEALRALDRRTPGVLSPDVISMDVLLPGINGFETTARIMAQRPTPIVIVSACTGREDLRISMHALAAGALTTVEKPPGIASSEYAEQAKRLCTQLAIMSQVKVVRRWAARGPAIFHAHTEPAGGACPASYRVLGIVSSTGGPNALAHILSRLDPGFPLPILLVQHITASFLEGFAAWLASVCPFAVEIVQDRTVPMPGTIYLAARDRHLRLAEKHLQVDAGNPVAGQRPSGTVLFESMAQVLGKRALGVLLTGMGADGAEGLLRIREGGGYTLTEDESTAVVYGMPKEAVRLGAASESLPLPSIAPRLQELTLSKREVA